MTNKEMNRYYQRQWREKNPERAKATMEKYVNEHREEINAKNRERNYKYFQAGRFPRKWISVDDFLPDAGTFVLVYYPKLEAETGSGVFVMYYGEDGWGPDYGFGFPSHWARVPAAPKEV